MLSLIHNPNQCGSCVVQVIDAPLQLVWSIIRRFDKPQIYKKFIKNCSMLSGNGEIIGSIREVQVVSGLPAKVCIERLDQLDDESHTISFSMIGGDHALKNYHSTITLHESEDDGKTILVEAYVVDVPNGNTKEDVCLFVETIIRCNHRSLAWITEKNASSSSDDS